MPKEVKSTTVLDLSKAFVYRFLYHPVIGRTIQTHYPLVTRSRTGYRPGFRVSKR